MPATTGITFIARRTKPGADVESSVPAPLEADNGTVTLSLGNVPGPKLQRGVYTFAFAESPSDRLGDWSSYVLAGQQGVWSIPGASFAYLILKVAYAS